MWLNSRGTQKKPRNTAQQQIVLIEKIWFKSNENMTEWTKRQKFFCYVSFLLSLCVFAPPYTSSSQQQVHVDDEI